MKNAEFARAVDAQESDGYVYALEKVAKEAHRVAFEKGHGDDRLWDALEALEKMLTP